MLLQENLLGMTKGLKEMGGGGGGGGGEGGGDESCEICSLLCSRPSLITYENPRARIDFVDDCCRSTLLV